MSQAIAKNPAMEFKLTILNGPEQGVSYKLLSSSVSIGRERDNDIVLEKDLKISRHHAVINFTPSGFEILNQSSRNKIIFNDEPHDSVKLKDGRVFQLGETQFRFNIQSAVPQKSASHLSSAGPGYANPYMAASKTKNFNKKMRFYIIVITVGGLLAWLLNGNDKKSAEELLQEDQIRTSEQVKADLEAAQALEEQANLDPKKSWDQSIATREAQAAYVRGFRDYQKGRYFRAMEAFQACLSLVPTHELCSRYLNLSRKKHNEIVQYHMILGRQYRDQSQFTACQAAFRNVMVMVRDRESAIYREAKSNYDACSSQLKGRF